MINSRFNEIFYTPIRQGVSHKKENINFVLASMIEINSNKPTFLSLKFNKGVHYG